MTHRQIRRLSDGGTIDRSRSIDFTFNGRKYEGHPGDTLASALLANGIRVVGRSFKYHRPRGIFSAGEEEPNALVNISSGGRQIPNCRATLVELEQGLAAESQNCFPSVNFDVGRVLDFSRPVWTAGFYNKTFKWPGWHWYERIVRRISGLGTLKGAYDPCMYYHRNVHCDILISGGGAAGLAAGLAAGRSGARVLLVEQDRAFGGRLLVDAAEIEGKSGKEWIQSALTELASMGNVRLIRRATVNGYFDHNVLAVVDRTEADRRVNPVERLWKVRASQVVITTGAIEQPLVFDYNDLPGIMLASAIREYMNRYGVVPGYKVAVATNNDEAYRTAFLLHDRGISVPIIVDTRRSPGEVARTNADRRGIRVIEGSTVSAIGGINGLRAVSVDTTSGPDDPDLASGIACDALAVSGGWNPAVHLYSQAGGVLQYDEAASCFIPKECRQPIRIAGAANGEYDLAETLAAGFEAGEAAARDAGFDAKQAVVPEVSCDGLKCDVVGPRIRPRGNRSRQWIDLQHDVTAADVELAVRENLVSVEHVKRYTTAGMSVDQGKTGNLNALTFLAHLTNRPVCDVGTTTFRPPYMPVCMGTIAGQVSGASYAPTRRVPAHKWHELRGAVFEDYGDWSRPAWYRRGDEGPQASIMHEATVARRNGGIFDGSPLGKIEVRGPDAAEFLNRIYLNNMLTLRVGCVRYGFMLDENGVIMDDGVCARFDDDRYLVSTTAANCTHVAAWLDEWHQCEWPELKLVIVPVTTQWAVVTVFGPNSRACLSDIDSSIDFSADAFPHMQLRTGTICGFDARIQRVSYTGELSYEISIPASHGEYLIERIAQSGIRYGMVLVGVEAILTLRIEKGYVHVGSDTDGTTNPIDVGFGGILDKKKTDFVGRRSLSRPNDVRADRRQLVGLEAADGKSDFAAGAHVVRREDGGLRSEGFVTSATESPHLHRTLGLGMVEGGHRRKGEVVTLFDNGKYIQARIVDPVFYDSKGTRLHG